MQINGQDQENPVGDLAKDMGKKAGNVAKEGGKQLAKKVTRELKKAALKVAKKAIMALGKALMKVLVLLGKYILIIGAILLIIAIVYYFLFESRGAEQSYTFDQAEGNQLEMNESGYYVGTATGKNKAVLDFYTALGTNAYYQVVGDDTELKKPDGTIKDEYGRESEFSINPNFLFVLDEFLYQGKFRYPEQFLQPVNYDPDTFTLKKLIDDKGFVIADSFKYDKKTGLKTTETEKSVHDFGLATIFKYKEDEEVYSVEGTITKRDEWDASTKSVVAKPLSTPEPFKEVMTGYPRKIYIIDKMVSFAQDVTFAYETTSIKQQDLDYGETTDPKQPLVKVKYGEYDEYEDYEYTYTTTDAEGNEIEVTETRQRFVATHDLYEYREGGVYETKPRPADFNNTETNYGADYLEDYLRNFNAWVPEGVMDGFNFLERGAGTLQTDIQLGSGDGQSLRSLWQNHYSTLEKYGTMYGVDPYLMLALWMAESSGRTDIEDGPFQIVGDGYRAVTAMNVQTNQKETFSVSSEADRRNPEKAIHWGTMYLAAKIQAYGDPLKGLQAYNFDVSGYMKEFHPQEWEGTTWMNYREEARAYYAKKEKGWLRSQGNNYSCAPELDPDPSDKLNLPTYGNACYLEHVLQYYIGDELTDLESVDSKDPEKDQSFLGNIISSIFGVEPKTYEDTTPREHYSYNMTHDEVSWTLKSIVTFSEKKLFSETYHDEDSDLAFWQDGFSTKSISLTAEQFIKLVPGADGYIPPLNIPNVENLISSMFGRRTHPVTGERGKMHNGMDIAVPVGTPIYAVADGKVEVSVGDQGRSKKSYGNYIKVGHDGGYSTLYGHLSEVYVKAGEQVVQGQLIGATGNTGSSTGPHLHFEFWSGSTRIDPYHIVIRPESFSDMPKIK